MAGSGSRGISSLSCIPKNNNRGVSCFKQTLRGLSCSDTQVCSQINACGLKLKTDVLHQISISHFLHKAIK